MKSILILGLLILLLGGILGTSIDVFDTKKQSAYIFMMENDENSIFEKMSIRQIDSLSAASNLSFTIKNAVR